MGVPPQKVKRSMTTETSKPNTTKFKETIASYKMAVFKKNIQTINLILKTCSKRSLALGLKPYWVENFLNALTPPSKLESVSWSVLTKKLRWGWREISQKCKPFKVAKLRIGDQKDFLQVTKVIFKALTFYSKVHHAKIIEVLNNQNKLLETAD